MNRLILLLWLLRAAVVAGSNSSGEGSCADQEVLLQSRQQVQQEEVMDEVEVQKAGGEEALSEVQKIMESSRYPEASPVEHKRGVVELHFPLPLSLMQKADDDVGGATWIQRALSANMGGAVQSKKVCIVRPVEGELDLEGGVKEDMQTKGFYFNDGDETRHKMSLFSEATDAMPAGCYTCLWPSHRCSRDMCLSHSTCTPDTGKSALIVIPNLSVDARPEDEALAVRQVKELSARGVLFMLESSRHGRSSLGQALDEAHGGKRWMYRMEFIHHENKPVFLS